MSHTPRKRFGQNFLRDAEVVHRIAMAIHPRADDHLVEIGPGEGVLTEALLQTAGRYDAIEIDRDLTADLRRRFSSRPGFHLHEADALRFDFKSLLGAGKIRVVGNLPYNISTPLMFHLFAQTEAIADMHFMLQNEVVDRLCAEPSSSHYGRLGIMASYFSRAEKLFEVFPESFYPPPKVVSAIVRLVPHSVPPVSADPSRWVRWSLPLFHSAERRSKMRSAAFLMGRSLSRWVLIQGPGPRPSLWRIMQLLHDRFRKSPARKALAPPRVFR